MMENEKETHLVKELATPLYNTKAWIRMLALASVVSGGSAIVATIIMWTAIFAWNWKMLRPAEAILPLGIGTLVVIVFAQLTFLSGVSLYKSTAANQAAILTGQKEKLLESLDQMQTYFKTMVVLWVLTLLLAVVSTTVSLMLRG